MDERRNRYSDESNESNSHGQAQPAESSYNSEAPGKDQQEEPVSGQAQNQQAHGQQGRDERHGGRPQEPSDPQNSQPQWQNAPQNGQPQWQNAPQGSQPQWQNSPQNGQPQWQNSPQNGQPQWQNSPQGSQPQWQNAPQGHQSYWQGDPQNNQPYWQNGAPNRQPYWQNNQPYWQHGSSPQNRNHLALASMITGIFALIVCCVPFIQFPLAVTAIVLVILSKKKQPLTGFAIAGLVLGILSILSSIVMLFYWGAYLQMMNDPEFARLINEMMELYQ